MIPDSYQELYEKGQSVELLMSSPGWEIVVKELEDIRSQAQRDLHETVYADAVVVKGRVMRWNCIEGLINELNIRLMSHVSMKNGVIEDLSTTPELVTDAKMRMEIDQLEPFEETTY